MNMAVLPEGTAVCLLVQIVLGATSEGVSKLLGNRGRGHPEGWQSLNEDRESRVLVLRAVSAKACHGRERASQGLRYEKGEAGVAW